MFKPHGDQHRELLDQMLDDTAATPDVASKRIMAALAQGAGPVAGAGMRWSETDRLPRFSEHATDALLQRAGLPVAKPHAAAKDLRHMNLAAMAESCVSMRGGTIRDRSPAGVFHAAHTTSDFPLLLANTANRALMLGFEAEPASHTAWVRESEAENFGELLSRVQRSEAPALARSRAGAEISEGSFSERREQYALQPGLESSASRASRWSTTIWAH